MHKTAVALLTVAVSSSVAFGAKATAWMNEGRSGAGASGLDDPTIVAIFDAANTADIETGTLAAERGQAKEVREFGEMLARDHKAVRQLGRDLESRSTRG